MTIYPECVENRSIRRIHWETFRESSAEVEQLQNLEPKFTLNPNLTSFCLSIISFNSGLVVLKFCTEHGSDTAVPCAQFQKIERHDDAIKWKHVPRYWPFVRGIHRSPVNSLHKGQWRRALMCSLICVWINGWVNNREAGDLGRYRAHYVVTVMRFEFIMHFEDI